MQAKGVAKDPGILRYRPLVVDAEDGETDLTKRALFEASTRLGRSTKITYTLQGWQHSSGLWEVNKQVRVIDTYFGTDAWFLISAVNFKLDQSGTLTEITVIPIEAFTVEPLKVKTEAKGKSKGKSKKSKGGGYGDVFN
jgi:prophage tail gpP-like protein